MESLTPPRELTTPPPPPLEKPERPQIVTGLKPPLGKVKVATDPSRPSTPAPETPITETLNPEKKARRKKKKQTETAAAVATGTVTPKTDEKPSATEVNEETVQPLKEGEKKDEVQVVTEAEKNDAEKKSDATALRENKEASPSEVALEKQAGTEASGNGISTDTPNPSLDPPQIIIARTDSKGGPPVTHKSIDNLFSPIGKPDANGNDLKDKAKPSLIKDIWGTLRS
jgi:hypothetical protein